nr:MAG TPA: Protein of unknown function (DUF739) [Caudoviricetes sp.]
MPTIYNYAYLRGFIREHFKTNQNFANFLGIGGTALYDRLSSKVPFKQTEIDKVGKKYNLSGEEVCRLFFNSNIRKTV